MTEKELDKLTTLWAKGSVILQEIGKILLRQPEIKERLSKILQTSVGIGGMELKATVRRKDGSIRKVQQYVYEAGKDGEGKLKSRKIKEM